MLKMKDAFSAPPPPLFLGWALISDANVSYRGSVRANFGVDYPELHCQAINLSYSYHGTMAHVVSLNVLAFRVNSFDYTVYIFRQCRSLPPGEIFMISKPKCSFLLTSRSRRGRGYLRCELARCLGFYVRCVEISWRVTVAEAVKIK